MHLTDFAIKPILTQPNSQLLSLPAELRLRIHSQIIDDPEDPVRIIESTKPGAVNPKVYIAPHPLTRTCRLAVQEFESMYEAVLSRHRVRTTRGQISVYVSNYDFNISDEV